MTENEPLFGTDVPDSLFPNYTSFQGKRGQELPYNNFHAYFFEGAGELLEKFYRNSEILTQFKIDHPHLDARLAELVTSLQFDMDGIYSETWQDEVEPLLYVAYRYLETYEAVREVLEKDPKHLTR